MKGKYKRKKERKDTTPDKNSPTVDAGEKQKHAREEQSTTETSKSEKSVNSVSRWWHEPAHVIQSVGILIGLIVAIIYGCQLYQMIQSNTLIRKTAEREDRAWVQLDTTDPIHAGANSPLGFKFKIRNIGKTPARHLMTFMWVEVVPINQAPDLSENKVALVAEVGDLFPNLPENSIKDISAIRQRPTTPRNPPNTEVWPMSETECEDFNAGRVYVVGYVRISYDDIFHVPHWTRSCIHSSIPSEYPPVGNCAAYNGEDDKE
jgi:hypothetical protein